MTDQTGAAWRKSARSNASGGNCVEVATNLLDAHGVVLMRDSKDPSGTALGFAPTEWATFVRGIKRGEFDEE